MNRRLQINLGAGLAAALIVAAPHGAAQSTAAYPTKPVRLIVAFAAGGYADSVARQIGQKLSERLGQHFVVDNRGGAGGTIAAKTTADATPDGYTLLVHTAASTVNVTLYKDVGFDLLKDFAPVANTVSAPGLFVVLSSHPANNLQDLIRMSRGKRLTYATAGVGTSSHIAGDYLLRVLVRLDAVHVPFKGGGPAVAAVLGNQVEVLSGSGAAWPFIKQGRMKVLGVSSLKRSETLPDVPTVAESGFPGFEERSWVGFFAPAKTPAAIVNRINREINEVLALPDVAASFKSRGMDLHPGSPADFARHLRAEVAMWAKIVKTTGVKAE
ncbi:MAG: Bug family tripartite tricarboxylate transporter substrate binding protein [Burkholderiales bacterium]